MQGKDDFMDFMGYRNMILEEKIAECLAQAQQGIREINIERGDLTDSELAYLQQQVERRLDLYT